MVARSRSGVGARGGGAIAETVRTHRGLTSLIVVLLALTAPACALLRGGPPTTAALAARPGFVWQTDTTRRAAIYYEAGALSPRRLAQVRVDVEASYTHILELLGEPAGLDEPVSIFLVPSRERMRALIGAETNGIAFPKTKVLCYIVNDAMMLSANHELLHVVAMEAWGTPALWVNEGLAVYADDHWHGYHLHELGGYLYKTGEGVDIARLTGAFRDLNDKVSYPLAGSLVKYLYETHGREAVRAIWRGTSIEQATGSPPATLQRDWRVLLDRAGADSLAYRVR